MAKKVIKLTESEFRQINKESYTMALETKSDDSLRIEDYFDINSLSPKDIKSIVTDIRVFFQGEGFNSNISDEGETIIKESANVTMPIGQLRQELKKLGFKKWQIKSEIAQNRIIILYADIARNTDVIINKMASYGWTKAGISAPKEISGIIVRVMSFGPEEKQTWDL